MVLTNKYISYNSEVNPCPGSRLRVDVAFRDEQGIFAMIELKRSAYIIREDFESSIWDKDEAETVLGSLLEPSGRTSTISRSFRGVFNGTKQVKAYARKNGCRFVALCDYNSLVLFVFDQDRVEYDRASAFLLDEKKFRIGLLGFLMKACTDGARESQRSKGEKTGCSGSKPDGSQCKRVTTDVENTGVSSRDDSNGELRWWCKDHVHQKDS
ncbi:hypothetical protein BDV95DRAFT_602093 [Massariosphaeria phaeospora]|uniref:Uncharacterized protein n=1 Tax=Massariosphaeria phaeospora TaxID=100035 RepID=A0A7C8IM94_9PLEO|nr:hypothetical protein BDV95DRAFT_602093 [Massariosphaeria phaeospora]